MPARRHWPTPRCAAPGVCSDNYELGRHFRKRFSVSLAACSVFNSHDNDITYFYVTRLPGESAPVEDRRFHPVEPRTFRLTMETRF